MRSRLRIRIDLRRLILMLAVFSALVMLVNGFQAAYQVQRELLIQGTLDANEAYAAKLAATTDNYLRQAQRQLAYGAAALASATQAADTARIATEVERLHQQADMFNTVSFIDARGTVRMASPARLSLRGQRLESRGALEALEKRAPLISEPYTSVLGNLVVQMSHPVETGEGRYLGYVAGTIYLREHNVLNQLLEDHYYRDGSYVYVVDRTRHLLYHPDGARVGTQAGRSEVIDEVLGGGSGQRHVVSARGVDMLAGYAPMPTVGWGIVAQRPTAVTLDRLDALMLDVLRRSVWPAAVALILVWLAARLISEPLGGLARIAREMDSPEAFGQIEGVRSWYFEAAQLKRAMLAGIGLLQLRMGRLRRDAQTDPMTGLLNRRGLELEVETWLALGREFSVVVIDIDHFKQVNDRYGHDVGDQVIVGVARLMRQQLREGDVACRLGGEEFLMLFPGLAAEDALKGADRLREAIAAADLGLPGRVTISGGVAAWPRDNEDFVQVLKAADRALYLAKASGRNRVMEAGAESVGRVAAG
ncbi:sensor domain-containing diguanylate cyclase [Castellaniella sp. GW247-6E4]|uniref:sensor domain-containing diguanylate cyclase n=1 Tax=Castellaniella sp. GW247-6E4 TaxID=3140380 RepID=UPI003315EB2C